MLLDGQIDAAHQAATQAVARTAELGFRFALAVGQRALMQLAGLPGARLADRAATLAQRLGYGIAP